MKYRVITEIMAASLILLWSYTAISKLADFSEFQHAMLNQPIPDWIGTILVWLLPVVELTAAVLLSFKSARITGFYISFILMLAFTAYIALILLNAFDRIPCSCGGILESMSWFTHLIFNILFTLIALTGMVLLLKERRLNDGNITGERRKPEGKRVGIKMVDFKIYKS